MFYRICLFVILLSLILPASFAQKIHLKKQDGGYWVYENQRKIFFFQREINDSLANYSRNNYFHPVYDLKGRIITEDFPADHPHHRGIFWAWHQILIDGKKICDGWDIDNFSQQIDQLEFNMNGSNGVFSYSSFWYTLSAPDDPIMREHTKVEIHPREGRYQRLDFTIALSALENNLLLGGSDDAKGYGGFSLRLKTDELTRFTAFNDEAVSPQTNALDAGRWINIVNPAMKNGLTIVVHPDHPDHAQWILRQTGSMQNCAWPGSTPVEIAVNEATVLRYSLLIHNGKLKHKHIQRIMSDVLQ
jgi:hypothetical protein